MNDTNSDTSITRKPEDYLSPVSGQIPVLLIVGIYLVAFILILQLFKKSY